jgi:hypothetical protein
MMAAMPLVSSIPRDLRLRPFRGSDAVRSGLVTWGQLRGPAWTRLLPDVYVAADVDLDHRLRCFAALIYLRGLGRPGVAVSGLSAVACWGVDAVPLGTVVELTVPPSVTVHSRPGELRVVRSSLAETEIRMFGSLPLTSPERTALDVIRRCDRVQGVVLLDAMLQRRIVSLPVVQRAALVWRGKRGGASMDTSLKLAEPLSESPMESKLRLVVVDAGLPRPVAQYVVRDADGRFVARLDLAYPRHRVGLEYEGDHHRSRDTFRRDIARLNALASLDWVVVRVTADDIYRNRAQLVQRIRELLSRRAPGLG